LVVPAWPETRPLLAGTPEPATLAIFRRVLADRPLQTRALLVAVLNVLVFSFYAAGPFMVGDLPGLGFGWIGLAIAIAGSLGALLNRRLPRTWNSARRVRLGLA
ncbi:MFS transporter, partial [Pseudomonas aeruginosa]|nr:MFS transporter [Pseudomonas aeruginosa]